MDLITRLNQELGKTILMVLHDLNLASRFAQHIVAIREANSQPRDSRGGIERQRASPHLQHRASIHPGDEHGAVLCVLLRSGMSTNAVVASR